MNLSEAVRVRTARALLGWTQWELAEKTGLSKSTIMSFEKDEYKRAPTRIVRSVIFRVLLEAGIGFTDNGVYYDPDGAKLRKVVTSEEIFNAAQIRSDPRQAQGFRGLEEGGSDLSGKDL